MKLAHISGTGLQCLSGHCASMVVNWVCLNVLSIVRSFVVRIGHSFYDIKIDMLVSKKITEAGLV